MRSIVIAATALAVSASALAANPALSGSPEISVDRMKEAVRVLSSDVYEGRAPGTPGDYNNDGKVDAGDYVIWRNAGPTDTLPNDSTPGVVDGSDYNVWRANFGKPPGAGSGLGGSTNVPEPTSMMLVIFGVVVAAVFRRTR